MIAVIDYDAGNIKSVENAFTSLGGEVVLTSDPDVVAKADKVVLPGVGVFGDARAKLDARGMDEAVYEAVKKGTPFLAICVGLQLLFDESEESPGAKGLSVFDGRIIRIPAKEGIKVPQIGWNSLHIERDCRLLKGIEEGTFVYFVHSYYLEAKDKSIVIASTDYSTHIHAAVEKDNVFATQFHPEKSGTAGLKILKNFMEL